MKSQMNSVRFFLVHFAFLFFIPSMSFSYQLPPANSDVDLGYNTKLLQELSSGVGAIAEKSRKALVYVSVSKSMKGHPGLDPYDLFGFGRRNIPAPKQEGLGSGFIIDLKSGLVLTNNHVIDGADEINLELSNSKTYKAKVVGVDSNTDIAVVKIEDETFDRSGLGSLILGDSSKLAMGSFVVALGAPFGLSTSLSFGVVSAVGRGSLQITQMGDFIQTDAAINPGNSGGPLVNMEGKVVGINTAIFSKSGGYNGIGFAVPSNLVRETANNLINGIKPTRGYIGIFFQPLTKDIKNWFKLDDGTNGVIVVQVEKGGPSDQAGIRPKDIIIAINGKPLEGDRTLVSTIGLMKPGSKAKLTLLRDGKKVKLDLKIGTFPGQDEKEELASKSSEESLGLSFKLRDGELMVKEVSPKSSALNMIQAGDVILSVDRIELEKLDSLKSGLNKFQRAVSDARKNKQNSVLMRIKRDLRNGQGFLFLTVKI